MPIHKLTKNEKLVFYGLVKYPEMNDGDLAAKISIKRSTINSIRNRLHRENFFYPIILPNLPALGCRLLGILYGKYNPLAPRKERMKAETFESKLKHPELVYGRSTDTEFVGIYIAKNLADIRRVQDHFILDYEAHGFIEEVHSVYFPFEMSKFHSLFNYAPLIKQLLGIKLVEPKEDVAWKNWKEGKLTNTEKIVLNALVKWPEANNIELAAKTGKTRATISKVRKNLLSSGLINILNVPALDKLGCELLVLMHTKFNPKYPMAARVDGIGLFLDIVKPFFKITGDMESVSMFVPKNYTDYTITHNTVLGFYKEKNYIESKPYMLLLPINSLKLAKLNFSALTEKLLFEK